MTTINTPHEGCSFDYFLQTIPKGMILFVGKRYNKLFKLMGDQQPDFIAAVADLTKYACTQMNNNLCNSELVYYQSVVSYVKNSWSAKFPLNVMYPLLKHFDGRNDGLVSIDSGKRFENSLVISPKSRRGISHADCIDLYRENIPGFDVREFYKNLVIGLKNKGY